MSPFTTRFRFVALHSDAVELTRWAGDTVKAVVLSALLAAIDIDLLLGG
jgi:hypothetical protein